MRWQIGICRRYTDLGSSSTPWLVQNKEVFCAKIEGRLTNSNLDAVLFWTGIVCGLRVEAANASFEPKPVYCGCQCGCTADIAVVRKEHWDVVDYSSMQAICKSTITHV